MSKALLAFSVALLLSMNETKAAPTSVTIALKSGESTDVANLFWAVNCRSLLRGRMTVEVLEGPPDVVASIKEQNVVPHVQNCAKPVAGGVLSLSAAKAIKARTQAKVVVRVKYPTVDGDRQKAFDIDLILLP